MKPLLQLWHFSFFFKFIFFYRKQLHQALNCRAIEIKTHSFTGNLLFPVCPVFAASIHSSSVSQTLAFWLSPTIKPGSPMPVFMCLATIHQGDASNKNRDPRCIKEERKRIPSPMYTPSTLAKGLERDVAATGYCSGSPGPSRVSQRRELLRRTRLDFGASNVLYLQVLTTLH